MNATKPWLPSYEEAAEECLTSPNPSAVAWFITEHEPAGKAKGEDKFRRELTELVDEVEKNAALRQIAYMDRVHAKQTDERVAELQSRLDFMELVIDGQFWSGFALGVIAFAAIVFVIWLGVE